MLVVRFVFDRDAVLPAVYVDVQDNLDSFADLQRGDQRRFGQLEPRGPGRVLVVLVDGRQNVFSWFRVTDRDFQLDGFSCRSDLFFDVTVQQDCRDRSRIVVVEPFEVILFVAQHDDVAFIGAEHIMVVTLVIVTLMIVTVMARVSAVNTGVRLATGRLCGATPQDSDRCKQNACANNSCVFHQ
jgi:hypothetical protein